MNKNFLRIITVLVTLALCSSCFGVISAIAAEGEEEVNKWDKLQASYMSAPFASVEERIYAEGPLADEINGNICSMRLIYLDEINGYAQYADFSTGEVIILGLVDRDGDGAYDYHPDYYNVLDEYGNPVTHTIKDIDGNDAYIMDYYNYFATNPYNIGATTAATSVKAELYSQIIVDYLDNGVESTYFSFKEAALLDQVKVVGIRNGTRVEYTVGEEAIKYLIPYFITDVKYNALIDQIKEGLFGEYGDDPDNNNDEYSFWTGKLTNYYKRYDSTNIGGQPEYVVKAVEKLGVCWLFDYKTAGKKNIDIIEGFFKTYTEYTYEQLDEDHAETGYTVATEDPAVFKLAIEYFVDENGLGIRCNAGNIRFDSANFQLDDVHLLPYAGSGDKANSGFVLYPDGSGATIDFKDATSKPFTLVKTSYGEDYSFSTISGANNEIARMPFYGMFQTVTNSDGSTSTNGYIAYVEEGESLADITVNSTATHQFLQVYTKFNPRPTDQYSLSGGISSGVNTMWTVEAKRKYTRNYKIRIFLLGKNDSELAGDVAEVTGYSEMAQILRNYLLENGTLNLMDSSATKKDVPLVIETLGAIESTKRVLGVPVDTMKPLTTFKDIQTEIIDRLQGRSVDGEEVSDSFIPVNNIVVKLNGWLEGGLNYKVPSGVKIEEVVGGSKGFKNLVSYCKDNNVVLYPDFDFTYSRDDGWFDGFDADDDLARTIDDRKAFKKQYDPIYQSYSSSGLGVISTNRMMHFYEKTYSAYKKYDVGTISVATLGQDLNSDFNEDDPLNREDSKVLVDRLLNRIKEQNGKVMLSGGNIYTVKYADLLLEVPLEDSMLKYTTSAVPFYSMVLHGCVEYAGSALNLAGDYQAAVLKTIESGAVPYFIVAVQNNSDLKNDRTYSKYYSVRYSIWLEDIYNTYLLVNEALKDVKCNQIVNHEFLDSYYEVVRVTYDNGISFVINYGLNDFTYYDDNSVLQTVGAQDFLKFNSENIAVNN